jgi:hypothetical protein
MTWKQAMIYVIMILFLSAHECDWFPCINSCYYTSGFFLQFFFLHNWIHDRKNDGQIEISPPFAMAASKSQLKHKLHAAF